MDKVKKFSINLLISFIINFVLLIIFSAILTYTNVSDTLLLTFVFASIVISMFIGSFILSKHIKEKGIIYGALFGFTYMLIVYAINLGAFNGPWINNTVILYFVSAIVAGMLGGIMGVNV